MLRRIQEAATEEELTRALKWWLILPQALHRQAKRSCAKRQSAALITALFQAVTEVWGKVLTLLANDKELNKK